MTNQTLLSIPVLRIMFCSIVYSPAATEILSYRNMFLLNPVFIISSYPVLRLVRNKSETCCWFSLENARSRCWRSWKYMSSIHLVCIFLTSAHSKGFCHFLNVWLKEKKDISCKKWEQRPVHISRSVEEKLPGLSSAVTSSRGVMASPRWWFLDNLSEGGWGQEAASASRLL